MHKFEQAGLGRGPFRFTGGVTEKVFCACPGAPVQPGSSCDYCGTAIRYEFWVQSADGRRFKVGSDCIHKTGDAGLIKQIATAEKELRAKKTAFAKARKLAKLAVRVAAAKVKLPGIRESLAAKSHPSTYYADQGRTLLDYVEWCLANAPVRACDIIEGETR